jgi:hypothetical protein
VISIAYEQLWLAVGSAGSMRIGKFIARMVLPYFVAPKEAAGRPPTHLKLCMLR